MIKPHLSFDFWNTLAVANPEYGKARNERIAEFFNVSIDYAKEKYQETKAFMDWATVNGEHITHIETYQYLAQRMWGDKSWRVWDVDRLIIHLDYLFKKYPATIPLETKEELIRLKEIGYTLSIGSNTNFSSGKVIREAILEPMLLSEGMFKFQLFSDEQETSKPHFRFFAMVVANARRLPNEILHIGDNVKFDGAAGNFGLSYQIVKNPTELAPFLRTLV